MEDHVSHAVAESSLQIKLDFDAQQVTQRLAQYSSLSGDEEPVPVRICIFAPSGLSGGTATKQELITYTRSVVEASSRCRHDPDAQFHLELHLKVRRKENPNEEKDDEYEVIKYVLTRQPVHLVGNYYKRSRQISQTPMFVEASNNKARVGINSVEEILFGTIRPVFFPAQATGDEGKVVFASAGREDVDVQVLGRGRPFMLTLHDPRANLPLGRLGGDPSDQARMQTVFANMQARALELSNGLVEVRNLRFGSAEERAEVLEGAEKRRKVYACVIELEQPLPPVDKGGDASSPPSDAMSVWAVQDLVIYQKTPVRVAHRRAMLTREKHVHELRAIQINAHHLVAYVYSSAGLYIKEFVHGDLGRTQPTLAQALGLGAGNRARLVSLDVLGSASDADAPTIDAFFNSPDFVW